MDESGPVEIIPPADEHANTGVKYIYDNGVEMIQGGPNGITFVGTSGLISVDRGYLISVPDSILKQPLDAKDVHLRFATSHYQDWLDCVRSRQRPIADVEIGARSVTVCHLGNLAFWNRRKLHWDPKAWHFVNDRAADAWLDYNRRDPWKLPTV